MAVRPVFAASDKAPYYSVFNAEFEWAGGFAAGQKQKNIAAMHRCFAEEFPGKTALEISSKSTEECGTAASAFFLKKYVPSLDKSVPVENVFQSGKVFLNGGPYKDLLEVRPIDAKRDERLVTSGRLTAFEFEGREFPLTPKTVFYDFIYINALMENPDIAKQLEKYDGFTDISFNPEKSLNCQARSAAIYVSLVKNGLIDKAKDFDEFIGLFETSGPTLRRKQEAPAEEVALPKIERGTVIVHKAFGEGKVTAVSDSSMKIVFDSVGEKTLGTAWVIKNCEIKE